MLRKVPLGALLALTGCGARTGLRLPDVASATTTDAARDAADAPDAPRPTELCVDLDPAAGLVTVAIDTRPTVSVADVLFLIDHTGSMDGEIDNIKANLQATIVPAIAQAIADVQFGVATYSDFPLAAPNGIAYGDPGDIPFTLVTPIERGVANVQGAVDGITTGGGGDNPEAMVEALYQVATGEGYAPWITARAPCATPGRLGFACLRPNAQSIIVLITDAPAHNGPFGSNAYVPSSFLTPSNCPLDRPGCAAARPPHAYADAVAALARINARVIGINSGVEPYSGRSDLAHLATDTGAVAASGAPLVFDISADGNGLDTRVVTAIQTFTQQVRFDASARIVDLDAAHPVTPFVRAVRPLSADPSTNVTRTDATTFYGVVPGTRLTFGLDLQATIPRMAAPQRFPARVQFYGNGRPNLGSQDLVVVIPGLDGTGCHAAPDGGAATLDGGTLD